ncbi:hypothetical protein [Pyxidicoccus sp. MSG2]|uniref:hypothetical protein n=1 Tax=Pyxidicoccus sp. MSG2 TaxID=2996790 RepID=UPI0022707234|nr:hypothetical protein [Pyxidicoccus sp. MSG2]MCY1019052.1 hypothetical protein [Pyxidicoccus sp. MSG2]
MPEFIKPDASAAPPPQYEFIRAELPPGVTMKPEQVVLKRRIFVGSVLTMFIASFVTFWIPLFNGLLGGAFGGFHAGRMKRALAAAAVNSVAVPGVLGFLYFFSQQDSSRFFYGLGFHGFVLLHVIGTFIGAVAGAASRPLATGDMLQRNEPLAVSASPGPVPGAVPKSRPARSTETVTSPPTGPVREE